MSTSLQDSPVTNLELLLREGNQPEMDAYTLSEMLEDLQERIRRLEEENAYLSSRVELLQDLCLAE